MAQSIKMALLTKADSTNVKESGTALLSAGKWKIVGDKEFASKLFVSCRLANKVEFRKEITDVLEGPMIVKIIVEEAVPEQLTIYAELQPDADPARPS